MNFYNILFIHAFIINQQKSGTIVCVYAEAQNLRSNKHATQKRYGDFTEKSPASTT